LCSTFVPFSIPNLLITLNSSISWCGMLSLHVCL
jgi:hypothetical protein